MSMKYINLNSQDRFVSAEVLRSAYIHYEASLSPSAPTFISFPSEDFELGIVDSSVPDISRAISSILSSSLEDAKYTNSDGGYLPPQVVERVQLNIISPHGISNLWGTTGHRFVLSRSAGPSTREILASILVARSKDTIFFLTGRYNNLRHSTIQSEVDLEQPFDQDPNQKWFDQFAIPVLDRFKPKGYHQIANFVVEKSHRRHGFAKFLINNIVQYYSRDYIQTNNKAIEHSQHLLCGRGFWQIGDPPWLIKMKALGFYQRWGAESFFVEHAWCPLPPIYQNGVVISNIDYNRSFGLPAMYWPMPSWWSDDGWEQPSEKTTEHLFDRIQEVKDLAENPRAKLQYFQAMHNFL